MGSSSVCHSLAASHASIGRIQHTQLATAVLPAVDVSRGERELRRSTDARGQKELRRRTVARGRKAVAAFQQRESPPSCECRSEPPRRSLVLGALAAAGAALTQSLPLPPHGQEAQAAEGPEVLTPFESEADCYRLLVPKEWSKGDGTVGTRKLVAWHPTSTTLTNVSLLLTPLGADFTGLGSFGTPEAFGESLVNGLDRSYLRKPGQRAELLSAKQARELYLIEYTLQKPGEDKVHLMSAVGVHFNGIYNQLYTLTAQYMEEDASIYEKTVRAVIDSFTIVK